LAQLRGGLKWWKGALGIERDASHEQKSIIGQGGALVEYAYGDQSASRQNGDNFRTNTVSLADYQDHLATNDFAVLGLSAAWACVNLLAGTQASLPLMVYRTVNGRRETAQNHPLYRVLHDSPNADQTALDFWEFTTASIELKGNAYSEIKRRNDGSVIALDVPIAPDFVQVRRSSSGALEYHVSEYGKSRVLPQEQMLHIRGFGGSPLGGLSTLAFGRAAFWSALSVERAASETFRQGARSVGAFVSDKQLSAVQMKEIEERVTEKYQEAVHAGRPLILNNGMTWHALSITPDDAQMLQSRAFSVEEVCRFFGVPPFMIGHTEKSTSWGTGLEQQTLGFQKFTLRRRLKRIEMALEKQLLTPADRAQGVTIEFNLEGLLRGDSKSRSEFYRAALGDTQTPGWMVRNEIRELENLPPVDGWDDPIPLISQRETVSVTTPTPEAPPA
jgi:HK97 family phage portal protein